MTIYTRIAQYHETDQMGVVHHSNYVKWFEEARTHWLAAHGIDYQAMERDGIYSPVTEVHVFYKRPVRYAETVEIDVKLTEYTGVKFAAHYEVRSAGTKEIKCTGYSKHCFVDKDGRIISIKKLNHFSHEIMKANLMPAES